MKPRKAGARLAASWQQTQALVLRRTALGDADWVVSLFTEQLGQISALAKHARKSKRRFGGGLEPFHTLTVQLDQPAHGDLLRLLEAELSHPRAPLLSWLSGMEAAGQLLNWVRHAATPHTPDPALWELTVQCLNDLAEAADVSRKLRRPAKLILANHGLHLLAVCGWRLELEQCVRSGVSCPPERAAMIDPVAGGLVSRACGGASLLATGPQRHRILEAQNGKTATLQVGDEQLALSLVHQCLRAHAGID